MLNANFYTLIILYFLSAISCNQESQNISDSEDSIIKLNLDTTTAIKENQIFNEKTVLKIANSTVEVKELKEWIKRAYSSSSSPLEEKVGKITLDNIEYDYVTISTWGTDRWEFYINPKNPSDVKIKSIYEPIIMDYSKWKEIHDSLRWIQTQTYFPVYLFSENISGITFDMDISNANRIIKQLYEEYISDNLEYDDVEEKMELKNGQLTFIENTARQTFWKNREFSEAVLKNNDLHFNIICQNKVVNSKIIDVLFTIEECKSTLVILRIDSKHLKGAGFPLFATSNPEPFEYNKLNTLTNVIWNYDSISHFEYRDKMKAQMAGSIGNLCFAYKDDFKWYSDKNGMDFPSRYILMNSDTGLAYYRSYSIDLFGIPCD